MPELLPDDLVMVVEDNPANMLLVRRVLTRAGFRTAEATSADEAIEVLAGIKPALILMDVQLPGRDGLSLTRELKANDATRGIVIVALTAHAMKDDRARILAAGCDGYITKPFDTRTFVSEIQAIAAATTA